LPHALINLVLPCLFQGVLHCDPHPGNLLRTPNGELCILDWGMTLPVPTDLQYSLIEFIAHVNAEDYDAMPEDFVALGFTPADQLERVKSSNLGEGLAFVLRQLSAGGGGKKVQGRVLDEWRERYGAELSVEQLREAARADMQARMTAQLASEGVDVNAVTNVMVRG
jgi:predicted unusual protein kinase regulating ubiquinone biosynthesis (AarF/ABC1/UbiB family)